MKNGEIDSIAGRVMGGPSSNSLARLSQSTAAAGGISTVNSPHTGDAAKYSPAFREKLATLLSQWLLKLRNIHDGQFSDYANSYYVLAKHDNLIIGMKAISLCKILES